MPFNIVPLKPFPLVVLLSSNPLSEIFPQIQNAVPGSSFASDSSRSASPPSHIIIDMLFLTGDNFNRFALIPFRNRKLILTQGSNYSPPEPVLETSQRVFFQNFSLLSNSIATDEFKNFIREKGNSQSLSSKPIPHL